MDARIIAATNRDLDDLIRERRFRRDLLYRLRVISLEIPPLRERREDVLPLARGLIARVCRKNSCGPCSLTPEALDLLVQYDWPGNVRELENAIERAVVLADGQPKITPSDLPAEIRRPAPAARSQSGAVATLAEVERRHILDVLERCGGNRRRTAAALGIGENTLWRRLRELRLPNPPPPSVNGVVGI